VLLILLASISILPPVTAQKKNDKAGAELDDLISTLRSGECFALDADTRRGRNNRIRRVAVRSLQISSSSNFMEAD
jgi:hypothetical protein